MRIKRTIIIPAILALSAGTMSVLPVALASTSSASVVAAAPHTMVRG
jgi:hypothetical protein